jgi:outer membrane protein
MQWNKISFWILLVLFAALAILVFTFNKGPKIAYVDLAVLYNDFTYKKELESNLTKTRSARQQKLDSLELELKIMRNQLERGAKTDKDISLFEVKKEAYFRTKEQLEEDNAALVREYDTRIYKQLTQYVKDYGDNNAYDYIYGLEGSGIILYSSGRHEITKEVLTYINGRYSGK